MFSNNGKRAPLNTTYSIPLCSKCGNGGQVSLQFQPQPRLGLKRLSLRKQRTAWTAATLRHNSKSVAWGDKVSGDLDFTAEEFHS
jgi:hypothetical protein